MRTAALLGLAALLIACDGRAAPERPANRPDPTPAQQLAQAAGARGEAPAGDYVCRLSTPESPQAGAAYGELSVRGAEYRLRLAGGQVLSGQIHSTPAGQLMWNGPLGPIDTAPRRIARAQVRTAGDTVILVFDFAPALGPPPATQAVCSMSVGASI